MTMLQKCKTLDFSAFLNFNKKTYIYLLYFQRLCGIIDIDKLIKHPEISREKVFFLPTLLKRDIFSGCGVYASFSSEMPVDI